MQLTFISSQAEMTSFSIVLAEAARVISNYNI